MKLPNLGSDPHHCTCFSIDEFDIDELKEQLRKLGFHEQLLQMEKGQVFGLVLTNGDDKQIHIKAMPNGQIEAEIEPTQDYPIAHLNQIHSYSAHQDLVELFKNHLSISYKKKLIPPFSCLKPQVIEPKSPSHINTILTTIAVGAVVGGVLYYLTKDKK